VGLSNTNLSNRGYGPGRLVLVAHCSSNICSFTLLVVGTWEADDPAYSRPIAAPLERCVELLGVDLATIQRAAADVEPYLRVDGSKVWSLMQLERRLRPEAYGRVRGGYVSRRRRPAHDQPFPQVGERGSERLEGVSEGVRPST